MPSSSVAHESTNAKMNSDTNTVPYDFNRVKMERPGDATDYVNASRVEMPSGQRFIVSQSPAEGGGVAEFWRLIWQERSPAVVMLTKTYELIKVMSACYWPIFVDKKEEYGEFTVRMLVEESYAHYKVGSIIRYLFLGLGASIKNVHTHEKMYNGRLREFSTVDLYQMPAMQGESRKFCKLHL